MRNHVLFVLCAVVGALTSAPAAAQIVTEPAALSVSVPQHETEARTVTLTNVGDKALAFCLSFDRPLQRAVGASDSASGSGTGGGLRLSPKALGSRGGTVPCGPYGDTFARIDENEGPGFWLP